MKKRYMLITLSWWAIFIGHKFVSKVIIIHEHSINIAYKFKQAFVHHNVYFSDLDFGQIDYLEHFKVWSQQSSPVLWLCYV